MIILIDNGHGSNTEKNGKFSPKLDDTIKVGEEFTNGGRFREWKYNRIIANQIVDILVNYGYDARILVPEDKDISLSERIKSASVIPSGIGHCTLMSGSLNIRPPSSFG